MNENIDLSKLSPTEQQEIALLIAENKRLANENLKLQSATITKDKQIALLESETLSKKEEIVKLQSESIAKKEKIIALKADVYELTKVIIKEKHLIAKYNLERYVSKADLPKRKGELKAKRTNGLPSTITKEKQKPGRKNGLMFLKTKR